MWKIACLAALAFMSGCTDNYADIRSLARQEAMVKKDLLGSGDCRVANLMVALRTPGSRIVYGTIKNSKGEYRHLWVQGRNGEIIDRSCPPSLDECRIRGYRAIVRTEGLDVLWVSPEDTSWRESHAYVVEFIKTVKGEI